MTDQAFEARLARDLVDLADGEILPFDVRSIAERVLVERRARRLAFPAIPRRWALPLLLALLGGAIVAGLIASQVLRPARADAYHAVLIRSVGDAVGERASGAVEVSIATPAGRERVVRRIRAADLGAEARSIQSGGSVSPDGWLVLFPGEQLRVRPNGTLTWAVAFIDLADPAKPPLVVEGHGAMGPRFGPDGLVGIPVTSGTVRVLDLDAPGSPERRVDGVAFVGGGPEIVWAADGSGFLAQGPAGTWGVMPIDGGPFRPGYPRLLSRWMSPKVPGSRMDGGVETAAGHYLSGGGLSADGAGIWSLQEEADGRVLAVSRAALDGSAQTTLRRIPAELAPGSSEGLTMADLDLAPDDETAAIRVDQADASMDHVLLLRTQEDDPGLPGARVDGRFVGWLREEVARRLPSVPQELVLEPTAPMERARSRHAATVLSDGGVLLTGGWDGWDHDPANDPDGIGSGMNTTPVLFDPVDRSFASTGQMSTAREFHTADVLPDGQVLISGGRDDFGSVLGSEVFDPGTGTFSVAPEQPTPRERHVSVTLDDGRVLLIGGATDVWDGAPRTAVIDIHDPSSETWTTATPDDQLADAAAATRLIDGDVIVLGSVLTVWADPADSRGALILDADTLGARELQLRRDSSLPDDLFGSVRGSALALDGRVLFSLRDERNQEAWPGDDSGIYALEPATGVVTLVAKGIGRPISGPVLLTDGRSVVLTDDPAACGAVTGWVIDAGWGEATSLGVVPGIGTCNGLPGASLSALPGDSLLIAGGNLSGGETTTAAALIHPVAARR